MTPGEQTLDETFYQVGLSMEDNQVIEAEPGVFLREVFWIYGEAVKHKRTIYSILDLLSDLGGVLEVFLGFFGVFLYPLSEFSFYLKIAKRLYFARTKDADLLDDVTKDAEDPDHKFHKHNEKLDKEIMMHKKIKLKTFDKVRLFISRIFGRFSPFRLWSKHKKLVNMYEQAMEKVDDQLNIIYIIKNLRNLGIVLENSLMTPEIKK